MSHGRSWIGAGALVLGALLACRDSRERRPADAAVATVEQQGDLEAVVLPERLATRREAQEALDSASAEIALDRPAFARRHLDAVATFARDQVAGTEPPMADSLAAVASELDSLSERIGSGGTVTVRAVERVSGRLNLAEAWQHHGQAGVALGLEDWETFTDNLVMVADHFERAAQDLSGTVPGYVERRARAARHLASSPEPDDRAGWSPAAAMLRELDRELRRLARETSVARR